MITDFIAQVKSKSLARTNRYEVHLTFPKMKEESRVARLFCDSASLPGINFSTTPSNTFGETREMPYGRMFDPVTFSFYVDAELKLKSAFDSWTDLIVNPVGRTIGYYNTYVQDVSIDIKTVDDRTPYTVKLFEAYPKTISSIQLDANGKEVMKLSVTMQYKYWKATSGYLSGLEEVFYPPAQDRQSVTTVSGYPLSTIRNA